MERLQEAIAQGAIDVASTNLSNGVAECQWVVVCTPIQQIAAHVVSAAKAAPQAMITDVGSTKESLVRQLASFPNLRFVGSHPMAGSEKSGCQHGSASLFDRRLVFVTPSTATPKTWTEEVRKFWEAVGAQSVAIDPGQHDLCVAQVSHLPHLIASALATSTDPHWIPMAASGWSSTTRVAAGDPALWTQILMENRTPVLQATRKFATILQAWVDALESGDGKKIEQLLEAGKQSRDALGNRHPSS
jgi:prephenate dehydrogenase